MGNDKMTSAMYETKRLILEPFSRKHLEGPYRSWFHDPEVTKYNSHGLFPYTIAKMEAFLASIEAGNMIVMAVMAKSKKSTIEIQNSKISSDCDQGFNYIFSETNLIHIGNISLQSINWINRSAEYAVIVGDKSYWGKGYATEASLLLFEHGFKRLNLHKIWTGTAKTNIGMQHVAKKLGMQWEGMFREAMFLNGQYVDILTYGILKKEFNQIS